MDLADDVWTFAISVTGELHVWRSIEMPLASNVARVPVRLDGDFVRVAATDLHALRQLIGEQTPELVVQSGPYAADELEGLLWQIHVIAQARIDQLRADDDEVAPPTLGMR